MWQLGQPAGPLWMSSGISAAQPALAAGSGVAAPPSFPLVQQPVAGGGGGGEGGVGGGGVGGGGLGRVGGGGGFGVRVVEGVQDWPGLPGATGRRREGGGRLEVGRAEPGGNDMRGEQPFAAGDVG